MLLVDRPYADAVFGFPERLRIGHDLNCVFDAWWNKSIQ